ncbi:MAG TPA: CRISPR-associated endonuclease Cas2 [Deltaproteobacteria bacterium]|nr:CRISPR-associated endonuclease Cas2 [Deltaproteobacteria bacterium]
MRSNLERTILAVYDIADETRLAHVAKIIVDYGVRVQQSVFELKVTLVKLEELHAKINEVIDIREDSVRYYLMCAKDWQKRQNIGPNRYGEPDWDARFALV